MDEQLPGYLNADYLRLREVGHRVQHESTSAVDVRVE
jgi:hypothetical protein